MQTVPKGKRIYVGAKRFVEGEVLPPFVILPEEEKTPEIQEIFKKGRPKKNIAETAF